MDLQESTSWNIESNIFIIHNPLHPEAESTIHVSGVPLLHASETWD